MNYIIGLPKKAIEKYHKELLALHKRCIKSYLVQLGTSLAIRRKFFILYDRYVSEKNILHYWNLPINLFVQAIVKNTLSQYFKYTDPNVHKHSKKSVRRKK